MTVTIVFEARSGDSSRKELESGEHVIGRDPDCSFPITGPGSEHVSWKHAEVSIRDDGVFLRDLDSSNGTFLNDRKMSVETRLLEGDRIALGKNGLQLVVESLPVPAGADGGPDGNPAQTCALAIDSANPPGSVEETINENALSKSGKAPPTFPPLPKPAVGKTPNSKPVESTSPTRALVVKLQKSQRSWQTISIVAVSCLGLVLIVSLVFLGVSLSNIGEKADSAEENSRNAKRGVEEAAKKGPVNGTEVYRRLLKSTAWIISLNHDGSAMTGTGSLIDKKRRLVITNHHVVGSKQFVLVLFPEEKDGALISEKGHYIRKARAAGPGSELRGRVIINNPQKDIAIIQLQQLPPDTPQLELAERSASPGARVHNVGNPGVSGALWAYTYGAVKQVVQRKLPFEKHTFQGWVVETQNPINKGDSGGPVVDDDGRLVAINMGSDPRGRLMTVCVDIREVKQQLRAARMKVDRNRKRR